MERVNAISKAGKEIFAIGAELLNLFNDDGSAFLLFLHADLSGGNSRHRGNGRGRRRWLVRSLKLEGPTFLALTDAEPIVFIKLLRADIVFGVANADFA